jgi:hypothetical protein
MPTTRPVYPDPEIGPFSAIFPYEELAKEEEEKKQRLITGQQRIQKTNVIGDAIRLLADSIGAYKGATVTPKGVNPGVIRASERMRQVQDQGDDTLMRLRLTDLGNRQKDLSYQQSLDAEKRSAERRAQELAQNRGWEQADRIAEQEFRAGESEKAQKAALALEDKRSENDIRQIYAREAAAQKVIDQNNPFLKRYKSVYGNKAPFMALPDLEMGVDIPLSDTDAMQLLKWMRNDPAVDEIDKLNINPSNLTNNLAFKNIVMNNWDRYKPLVRKMASGEKITPDDEKAMYEAGLKAKRWNDYESRRQSIDITRKKGAKQLQELNDEYADLFDEGTTAGGGIQLKPEESQKIDGMINAQGYTPEQKRSAAYSYLVKQGYDDATAKEFAEFVYSNLK